MRKLKKKRGLKSYQDGGTRDNTNVSYQPKGSLKAWEKYPRTLSPKEAANTFLNEVVNPFFQFGFESGMPGKSSVRSFAGDPKKGYIPFKETTPIEKEIADKTRIIDKKNNPSLVRKPKPEIQEEVFPDPLEYAKKHVKDNSTLSIDLEDYYFNVYNRPVQFIKEPKFIQALKQSKDPEIQKSLKYMDNISSQYKNVKYATKGDLSRKGVNFQQHESLYNKLNDGMNPTIDKFINTIKKYVPKEYKGLPKPVSRKNTYIHGDYLDEAGNQVHHPFGSMESGKQYQAGGPITHPMGQLKRNGGQWNPDKLSKFVKKSLGKRYSDFEIYQLKKLLKNG